MNLDRDNAGMDWKQLISDISATGLTQAQIATKVGVAQSFISCLASGRVTDPRDSLGQKLRALHRSARSKRSDPTTPSTQAGQGEE